MVMILSEDIAKKFLSVYERAKEKIGDEMATWNKAYQFEVTGLEPFYIEFKGGEVKVESGKHPSPLATLTMEKDVLMKILDLELDPMVAFMRGMMKISGNVMETVHLRKMFEVLK
jgi:putative sterol carrier protein